MAIGPNERWSRVKKALTELVNQGYSASKIAAAFNAQGFECSRNGVISACHRFGLKLGARQGISMSYKPVIVSQSRSHRVKPKLVESVVKVQDTADTWVEEMPKVEGVQSHTCTIYYLSDKCCRWPLWTDPDAKDKFYCGQPTVKDKVYCSEHCALGYQLPRSRAG